MRTFEKLDLHLFSLVFHRKGAVATLDMRTHPCYILVSGVCEHMCTATRGIKGSTQET